MERIDWLIILDTSVERPPVLKDQILLISNTIIFHQEFLGVMSQEKYENVIVRIVSINWIQIYTQFINYTLPLLNVLLFGQQIKYE